MRIFLLLFVSFLSHTCFSANYYWVCGTGNWSDYTHHWATTSGGAIFYPQVPQSVDNVFFDANSFSAPGQTVTVDQTIVDCDSMSWVGATNNPTFYCASTNIIYIYGSLQFIPAMSVTVAGNLHFSDNSTGARITSSGKVFTGNIYFDGSRWRLDA